MTCPLESMKWYIHSRRSMNLAHAIEEQSAFGYAFDRFSCNCENDISFWSSSSDSDIIPKHLALNISFASLLKSLPLFPRKPIIRGNTECTVGRNNFLMTFFNFFHSTFQQILNKTYQLWTPIFLKKLILGPRKEPKKWDFCHSEHFVSDGIRTWVTSIWFFPTVHEEI